MKSSLSMAEYLQQVKSLVDTLVVVSSSIEEEDIVLHVLNGLPTKYHPFKTAIRTRSKSVSVAKSNDLLLIEEQLPPKPADDSSLQSNEISSAFTAL